MGRESKMCKNLSIRQKLIIMPAIAAAAFVLITLLVIMANLETDRLTKSIQSEQYPLLEISRDLEQTLATMQRGMQDAVASADEFGLEETDLLIDSLHRKLESAQLKFPAHHQELKQLQENFEVYYQLARTVSRRMITEETNENLVSELHLMTQRYNDLKETLRAATAHYQQTIDAGFEYNRKRFRKLLTLIILLVAAGIIVLTWISVRLTSSITRPLNEVVEVSNRVAEGRFDVGFRQVSTDEIGVLQSAFRTMIKEINHLLQEKDAAFEKLLHAKRLEEQNAKELQRLNVDLLTEIQERRKAEEELAKHRNHLEELVQERTAELQAANQLLQQEVKRRKEVQEKQKKLLLELASTNQELKDFAYIVSHDLKAPLRAIGSLASWLQSDYEDQVDEEGQELLRLLDTRVKRMHSLIEGILQYSRLGRIREELVDVNLQESLPAIIDMLSPPAHIRVTIETCLPTVHAERTRIEQVFQNLLSNAIKYMDKPRGEIKVGCREEGDYWKFWVGDNGPGIDQKYHDKIFKIFQTLNARDDYESTGVGLTLIKKIIEMYGGKVWLESTVGQGATFYFTFPKGAPSNYRELSDVYTQTNPVS